MGSIASYNKKDGTTTYHAEVRLKGHRPERQVFRTKTLAKEWIRDTEAAIRDGRYTQTSEARRHTLGDMIQRFIEQWLPKYPKRQAKQTALLKWWKERIGDLLLAEVTPAVLAAARDVLSEGFTTRKSLRTSSTVNRYMAALSKVFTVAVNEWGWLHDSPMKKVSKLPENKGRDRLLTLDEKDRLLAACKASSSKFLYTYVVILLLTGIRHSECIRLRWQDISFEQKRITIRETKNGTPHVIPLTDVLERILLDYKDSSSSSPNELLFPSVRSHSKHGHAVPRKAFLKALQAASIKNFRTHDLRHAAASFMAMNGATQGELMTFLNHRCPAMTKKYTHYSAAHMTELMNRTNKNVLESST